MDLLKLSNEAKNFLSRSDFESTFNLLDSPLKDTILYNELIVIKSKYSALKPKINMGLMDENMVNIFQSQVVSALLQLIDNINILTTQSLTKNAELHLFAVGLEEVAEKYQQKLTNIKEAKKVTLSGRVNILDTYVNAIKRSNWRFYTTSFLDSEFWHGLDEDHKVIHENLELYHRIKNRNGQKNINGLKRLFIIPDFFDSYIKNKVDYAISQKKAKNPKPLDQIETINRNLADLAESIDMKLLEKVKLPPTFDKGFDISKNIELALYDDFRVDSFKLNNEKRLSSVDVYTKHYPQFPTINRLFLKYFENSWNDNNTRPISEYLSQIQDEIKDQLERKIDYESNWLLKYERYVMNNHHVLNSEKSRVLDFLSRYSKGKKFKNYLDIGVCTARYPTVLMNEKLVDNIDTIDSDYDVELFMKTFKPSFNFLRVDITLPGIEEKLTRKYDLITCMLGTACHFGLSNIKRYDNVSGLERALRNINKLLACQGLLIVSNWKKWSVLNEELSLYNKEDIKKLRENTPTKNLLMNTLNRINSGYFLLEHLGDEYFDIYVFKKN